MDRNKCAAIGLALLLGAASAGGAAAQTLPANFPRQGEMGYLNGGVGEEQAELMRDMSSQFPIRMTFSQHDGTLGTDEFVADVRLRVTDHTGRTVLNLAGQGPIFLLRLPAGSYSVEAAHHGDVKARRFEVVPGRHENLAFSWR
ncbi:MAG TPA: hypothetical protein VF059_10770 [Casimicrobiaceae bacterium]